MILIILGDGVVAGVLLRNSKAENSGWIVITFGWAMAVAVAVYCVPVLGAFINPAVTIGLRHGPARWAGARLHHRPVPRGLRRRRHRVAGLPAALGETEDEGLKLGVFCTAPAIYNTPANVITEIIGTFVLVFGVSGIMRTRGGPGRRGCHRSGINPLLVGLLVLGIGLSLGGPTGYAINPARDLGPRIAHAVLPIAGKGGNDWGYAWIPVVAPIIGGILGAVTWVLF